MARRSLGRCARTHRHRLVLVVWIVLIIGVILLGETAGNHPQQNRLSGHSPSQQAQNRLAARFPGLGGGSASAVRHTVEPIAAHPIPTEGPIDFAAVPFDQAVSMSSDGRVNQVVRATDSFAHHRARVALRGQSISLARAKTAAGGGIGVVAAFGSLVIGDPLRVLMVLAIGLAASILLDDQARSRPSWHPRTHATPVRRMAGVDLAQRALISLSGR